MKDWLNDRYKFEVKDVRNLKGNFLPSIMKKAQNLDVGKGICIVQSFEPIPLYSAMSNLGYEHETDKVSDSEYRVYFFRVKKMDPDLEGGMELPFKPTAIVNFNTIDPTLANNVVNFWNLVWGKENPAVDMKTKLLLSLANGVGAGRMRQAVREFVKAYSLGVTTEEFDEVLTLLAWNQGIGNFASEIGPSALFGAYTLVKNMESKGHDRGEIVKTLIEKFGDKNPEVNTFFKKGNN